MPTTLPQAVLTLVGVVTSLADSEAGVEKPEGKRRLAIVSREKRALRSSGEGRAKNYLVLTLRECK